MKKARKVLIVVASLLMLGATVLALVGEGQIIPTHDVALQVDSVGQALSMLNP